MGEILTNHNATKLDPNLTNVGYLTSSGKKAVGVIGEVMLIDHDGVELSTPNAVETSIVDTTNVATGTYYPGSTGLVIGAYKNLSITGKLIDGAAETTTLTVEVTNDSDLVTGDWVQIYLYDVKNDTTVNSIAATNQTTTFALLFDNFNFTNIRFLITATAATNTVIIKLRQN
jgi:hypothetical protein